MENITSSQFKKLLKEEPDNLEIIDVREPDEYDLVKIKDSKLIPMAGINNFLDKIDWSKKVIFVCRSGARSSFVAQTLAQSDKEVINLSGGIYELNLDNCDCLEKSPNCCDGYF